MVTKASRADYNDTAVQATRAEVQSPPKPTPDYKSPCTEAADMVHGTKGADYGRPLDDFQAVAQAMNAYLGKKYGPGAARLGPEDIPIFQILVKVMREAERPEARQSRGHRRLRRNAGDGAL
jgi:hypothetical protein